MSAAPALAANVGTFDTGWYSQSGTHYPNSENFILGATSGIFFAFDLSSLGSFTVTGATLRIFTDGSYNTSASSVDVSFYDVSTDIDTLLNGGGGTSAYADLRGGTLYGSANVATPGANGAMPEVTATLSASAISDLNAVLGGADGRFAIGAAHSGDAYTSLWGFSGGGTQPYAQLELTGSALSADVPVPAAAPLLIAGIAAIGAAARRQRRN